MKKIALTILTLILTMGLFAQETKPIPVDNPEAQVKGIMKIMIYLMENGNADEVLVRYADPRTINTFKKDGNLAKITAQFKAGRYKRLLAALKKSITWQAEVSDDKTIVTFVDPAKDKNVVFMKIDGIWYLGN